MVLLHDENSPSSTRQPIYHSNSGFRRRSSGRGWSILRIFQCDAHCRAHNRAQVNCGSEGDAAYPTLGVITCSLSSVLLDAAIVPPSTKLIIPMSRWCGFNDEIDRMVMDTTRIDGHHPSPVFLQTACSASAKRAPDRRLRSTCLRYAVVTTAVSPIWGT